jgi:hypothetical protein
MPEHARYDLLVNCDLKADIPQQVLETLQYMVRVEDYDFDDPPQARVFEGHDWRELLRAGRSKFVSFPGEGLCSLSYAERLSGAGEVQQHYTLHVRRELTDELGTFFGFLEWLAPYVATVGFVGYWHALHEEHPVLLYFKDGRIYISQITQKPIDIRSKKAWS